MLRTGIRASWPESVGVGADSDGVWSQDTGRRSSEARGPVESGESNLGAGGRPAPLRTYGATGSEWRTSLSPPCCPPSTKCMDWRHG